MDIVELAKQIKEKSFQPFYIFTGPEAAVADMYINKVQKASALTKVRIESVASAMRKIRVQTTLSPNKLFIVRDDADFMKAEKDWQKVIDAMGSNIMIFLVTNLDKRGKFYKRLKDSVVVFEHLTTAQLTKHIMKDASLSKQSAQHLAQICENDYGRILNEINKITNYAEALNLSDDSAFAELLQKGGVFQPIGDITFDFVDAVLQRNTPAVLKLSEQLKQIGESPMLTLSTLYTGFRNMFLVPAGVSTGLTPWQIKNVYRMSGHYRDWELTDAMQIIHEAEKSVKKGILDPEVAVDTVIIEIMGL